MITSDGPLAGVYAISDPATGMTYIGQSRDVAGRWNSHARELTMGMHRYQYVFASAWQSKTLRFDILERVADVSKLGAVEQAWIERLRLGQADLLVNGLPRPDSKPNREELLNELALLLAEGARILLKKREAEPS